MEIPSSEDKGLAPDPLDNCTYVLTTGVCGSYLKIPTDWAWSTSASIFLTSEVN